jgi:phage shock protein A
LAAIQGLNQKLEERTKTLEQELNRQDAENAMLKHQNDSLAERLYEVEATVKQLAANK